MYHGYTLTTKILFKDVVATVERHAFEVPQGLAAVIHKATALASRLTGPNMLIPCMAFYLSLLRHLKSRALEQMCNMLSICFYFVLNFFF